MNICEHGIIMYPVLFAVREPEGGHTVSSGQIGMHARSRQPIILASAPHEECGPLAGAP